MRHFWIALFPMIVGIIPFVAGRGRITSYDTFCLFCFVFNLLGYFFYMRGPWGNRTVLPIGGRYYNESALLCFVPLVARGLVIAFDTVKSFRTTKLAVITFLTVILSLFVNSMWTNWTLLKIYKQVFSETEIPTQFRTVMPKLVKQQSFEKAVVLAVPTGEVIIDALPLGDYPFVDLSEAKLVYYRLNRANNWRKVYDQFFKGRTAYIFQDGTLSRKTIE